MVRGSVLVFLTCALLPVAILAANQKRVATKGVSQLELIYPNDVTVSSTSHWKRSNTEDTPDTLDVTLNAFGKQHYFSLEKNYDLFAPTSKVTYVNGNDESTFRPRIIAYKGKGDQSHNVRLTVLETRGEDVVFKGFFNDGDETYFVDPIGEHLTLQTRSETGANMVVFRDIDIINNPEQPVYCGHANPATNSTEVHEVSHHFALRTSNPAPPLPQGNCPTSLKALKMSVVADHTFNTKIRSLGQSDVGAQIQSIWNSISQIFERTINVRTVLDEVIIHTAATSDPYNAANCIGIMDKLYDFTRFRGTRNWNAGLWHLLTACYTGDLMGYAWIGVTCAKSILNQGNIYYGGTAVSSYMGTGSYLLVAHEVGHNLGAEHTADGLMQPSVSSDVFRRESQTQMCNHLYQSGTCLTAVPTCTPNCSGKQCGANGCGGSCGTCAAGQICSSAGICTCTPNCNGKQCGDNGCGGSCGTCSAAAVCSSTGTCVIPDEPEKDTFLRLHNEARALKDLPPVVWSDADYQVARAWAVQCKYQHSSWGDGGRGDRGENLYPLTVNEGAEHAVKAWLSEEENWNCRSNECVGTCGDYTQIVWESTSSIGCAVHTCNTGSPLAERTWKFVVCAYSPPGNYLGERPFPANKCTGTCTPSTSCAAEGRVCGTLNDGCERVTCGTCPTDSQCNSQGQCECRPSGSCAASGRTCGTYFDGCNNNFCGNCTNGQTCNAQGRCEDEPVPCVPSTSCRAQGKTCGSIWNGCETEECGACASPESCVAGVCTACSNCHQYATCQNNRCVCRDGYTGDGTTCEPVPSNPGTGTAAWRPVIGTRTGWRMTGVPAGTQLVGDELEQVETSGGPHIVRWIDSENLFQSTYTVYSADVQLKASNAEGGIVISLTPSNSAFWSASITTSTMYLTWWNNGYYTRYVVGKRNFAINTLYNIEIIISDRTVATVKFNGETFGPYSIGEGTFDGAVGLATVNGPVSFSNVKIQTKSSLRMALTSCDTPNSFRQKLANALGIPPSAISDIRGTSDCPSKKRQGAGTESQSASAIASQLSANQANGHISMEGNGVASSSVTQQPSGQEGTPIESLPIEAVAGIVAGGLAVGIIVAIVIAAVIFTGGATVGTVVAVKKYRASRESVPAEIPMSNTVEPEPNRKPKGVDVYSFDPSNITSLTGRSQHNH